MSPQLIVILSISAVVLLYIIMVYNGLIRKKNNVDNAFAGIDVQLKKRYDLIPNLVATVQEYMSHEKELLERITALRTQATKGQLDSDEKVALDNQISQATHGIMVAVENYPDLKSSQNFVHLQKSFNEVESQISAARRAFNAMVTDYNNGVEMFPSSIFANMMNYKKKNVFEIPEVERQNISAKDLFKK